MKLIRVQNLPDAKRFTFEDKDKKLFIAEIPTEMPGEIQKNWYNLEVAFAEAIRRNMDIVLLDFKTKPGTAMIDPEKAILYEIVDRRAPYRLRSEDFGNHKKKRDWHERTDE